MNDEQRRCGPCGHDHRVGILRYSPDNVPLYGARKCWCGCDHFAEKVEGAENLPALTEKQTKDLWAATSFLNPQVPMATRIAVRQITELMKSVTASPRGDKSAEGAISASLGRAVTEFMGLMISQLTDLRGAFTRTDGKFAHLVAHTDEVVEAMRGVVQLSERLNGIYGAISQIQEQQAKTERDIAGIAAVLKTLAPDAVMIAEDGYKTDRTLCAHCGHEHLAHQAGTGKCLEVIYIQGALERDPPSGVCPCERYVNPSELNQAELRRVFLEKSSPLRDEPILTDADAAEETDGH